MTSIPPSVIARQFVQTYYRALSQDPESLHAFYHDESTFSRLEENEVSSDKTCSVGQVIAILNHVQPISEAIKTQGYGNCNVEILSLDSHLSVDGGVVILVNGVLSNAAGAGAREFSQLFFLARQPGSNAETPAFYVHNDIMRYSKSRVEPVSVGVQGQPEMAHIASGTDDAEFAEAAAAAVAPAPAASEPDKKAEASTAPAAAASAAVSDVATAAAAATAAQLTKKPAPDAGASSATKKQAESNEPKDAPAGKSKGKPTKWSQVLGSKNTVVGAKPNSAEQEESGAMEHALTNGSSSTTAAAATAAPGAKSAAAAAAATAAAAGTTAAPVSGAAGKARGSARSGASRSRSTPLPPPSELAKHLFVGGLPDRNVTAEELAQLFAKYGNIVNVDIPAGKNHAFVIFDAPSAINAITSAGPFVLRGATLTADPRKPRNTGAGGVTGGGGSGGVAGGSDPAARNRRRRGGVGRPDRRRGGGGGGAAGAGPGAGSAGGASGGGRRRPATRPTTNKS